MGATSTRSKTARRSTLRRGHFALLECAAELVAAVRASPAGAGGERAARRRADGRVAAATDGVSAVDAAVRPRGMPSALSSVSLHTTQSASHCWLRHSHTSTGAPWAFVV